MASPVVFHEVKNYSVDGVEYHETFCGGKWYANGKAPCELMDADDAAALADLPACEADIAAMREVLGLTPKATVCRFKGRASWDDKLPESPGVLPGTVRTINGVSSYYDGVRWITEVKSR